ncbi:frizzled-7-like [Pecten maximus]|uniref:frizzled-7-like n=1 Tax=Pecten maximus TaxID=6579 RepID=UPI0014586EEB|nr:frizzled-7-like [Pecten maximus]
MQTVLHVYASLLLVTGQHLVVSQPSYTGTCQPMATSMCDTMPYNRAFMPNRYGHTETDEAVLEVQQFLPVVESGCSPALRPFLCSLYLPSCSPRGGGLQPCAGLCRRARGSCDSVMESFGYVWPRSLDCHNFPENYRCFDIE